MRKDRYRGDNFAYGIEPNSFLVEHAELLTGPVLSLAESEGRNAVYLASLGLDVLGVDASDVGLAKAHKLAEAKGVSISTELVDLATYVPTANGFGSVVSISAHLPTVVRRRLYPLIEQCLKPGGIILLEAYAKSQLSRNTGGPKDPDMLLAVEDLREEFSNCDPLLLQEVEREVVEGEYHTGLASVVQFIGRKT